MPICSRCRKAKPLRAFTKSMVRPSGHVAYCKPCMREYQRLHYGKDGGKQVARNKRWIAKQRALVDEVKAKTPCADCGRMYPPFVMDFDHVNAGNKLCHVADLRSVASTARIVAEMAKCELVCANCHRIRTHVRKDGGSSDCGNVRIAGRVLAPKPAS